MSEKSNLVATTALAVSITTAMFSAYQWLTVRPSERIKAALDISRDWTGPSIYQLLFGSSALVKHYHGGSMTADEFNQLLGLSEQLEYIATLSNTGLVDENYLSPAIKCAVIFLSDGAQRDKRNSPIGETGKLAQRINCTLNNVGFFEPRTPQSN